MTEQNMNAIEKNSGLKNETYNKRRRERYDYGMCFKAEKTVCDYTPKDYTSQWF